MNSIKSVIRQLHSLKPRPPSPGLKSRLFGTTPVPTAPGEAWPRVLVPLGATAIASLVLSLGTVRDFPGSLRARGGDVARVIAGTGMTLVASLPASWHSVQNPAPSRLDWTNGGAFSSSIGSLAKSSTNQLR